GFPDINIISEENKEVPYSQRKEWASFWLVDPLDGTTEFIKRNGEFTVNIALIESGVPILGVVYVPVSDTLYYGSEHGGFVCVGNENSKKLPLSMPSRDKLLVVASRSHFTDETRAYVESRGKDFEIISKGSSLKLCVVAEGTADIYPRLGPTMEWDTAAAHAIANAAGKKVHLHDSEEELRYNKESLLNPWFVVE
ncbi:MAG: 3'(2'),5'-bisphosphate nucleotidase CysQ, partial [Candidatus Nanoarchaeia archaeon]